MTEPIWRQRAEDLRRRIESGELGSGGYPLPSEGDLAREYGVSRNTIRSALGWLINHRVVQARPGLGTFVVQIKPFVTVLSAQIGSGPGAETAVYTTEVAAANRTAAVSDPRIEIQQVAATPVADELELEEDASVLSRHQRRFIDDEPWSLQTTFYPMSFVDRGATDLIQAKDMPGGTVQYVEVKLGIKEAGWRDKFTVRAPDDDETDFFKLPSDGRVGVVEIVRTGYDESGLPFRVTRTTYPADRNQFVMTGGKLPMGKRPPAG